MSHHRGHNKHVLPKENYIQPVVHIHDLEKYFADEHHFNQIYEPRHVIDQHGRRTPQPDENTSRFGQVKVFQLREQIQHERAHHEAEREAHKSIWWQVHDDHHHEDIWDTYGAQKPCPFPQNPITPHHDQKWNHHYSVLPRWNHPLPRQLPVQIAVKTFQVHHHDADKLKDDFQEGHLDFFLARREFLTVLFLKQQGNSFTLYFEYPPTLEDEIIARRSGTPNPFSEELLWQLMLNLVSAASKIPAQQRLQDIRPSRVHYSNWNAAVVPSNIFPERDDRPLAQKFAEGREPIFYSPDARNEFSSKQNLHDSHVLKNGYENESYQIGLTVLCAGLLKTERELGIHDGKGHNDQKLTQYLKDIGDIYGQAGRLLQFVLTEIFLIRSSRKMSPQQILAEIFAGQQEANVLWLETLNPIATHLHQDQRYEHFREHLHGYFKSANDLAHKFHHFSSQFGPVAREQLPNEIWQRYPFHFYFISREAEFHHHKHEALSKHGARLLEGHELEEWLHHNQGRHHGGQVVQQVQQSTGHHGGRSSGVTISGNVNIGGHNIGGSIKVPTGEVTEHLVHHGRNLGNSQQRVVHQQPQYVQQSTHHGGYVQQQGYNPIKTSGISSHSGHSGYQQSSNIRSSRPY